MKNLVRQRKHAETWLSLMCEKPIRPFSEHMTYIVEKQPWYLTRYTRDGTWGTAHTSSLKQPTVSRHDGKFLSKGTP